MNIYVFTAAARWSGTVGPLSIRHESLRRRGGPGAVETSTPRTVLRRPRLSTQAKNKNSKNMAPYNTLPQTTNEAEETLLQAQKPKTSLKALVGRRGSPTRIFPRHYVFY